MLNDPSNETNWGTQPIVIKSPRDPLRIQKYTKLKTNLEGSKGKQLKVGLPAAVKKNGSNILVVRIPYDFRAREPACKSF